MFNIRLTRVFLCDKLICKSLRKILKECLRTGTFPLEWKKVSIDPILKKRR